MDIGKRMRDRRKELGMSAEELGKRLGKDRSTIYRYEKGDIENLPLDLLEPIARILQTTPAYLMGWEDVQKKNDAISDIVFRLRTDETFLSIVQAIGKMEPAKLSSLLALLK